MADIPIELKSAPQVDVHLQGTEDVLFSMLANLDTLDNTALNEILVKELCQKDGPFCSHCLGNNISFVITRDCKHKISVWPTQNGKRLQLIAAD